MYVALANNSQSYLGALLFDSTARASKLHPFGLPEANTVSFLASLAIGNWQWHVDYLIYPFRRLSVPFCLKRKYLEP